MLQRYDIVRNDQTNRFSIRSFAVLEKRHPTRDNNKSIAKDYSFVHEVSFDSDIIRAAINKGPEALISALRSDDFFPIHSLAKIIAKEVTKLFNGSLEHFSELFFDDRSLLSVGNEKY